MVSEQNTILLVEDDELMRRAVSDRLVAEGWQVLTAGSALEGLEHLKANKVDLVILDLLLEGRESGPDMVQMAKDHPEIDLSVTGFVVLSVWDDPESALAGVLPAGSYDFLYKPETSLDKLVERVKKKLGC